MINRDNYHYLYRLSKKTIPFLKKKNRFTFVLNRKEKNDTTNSLLTKKILENKPYMVARYGSTESRAILNFLLQKNKISEVSAIIKHITGKMNIYWKNHPKFLNNLVELSGFFPKEEKQLEEFVNLYINESKQLDLLGIWNEYEEFLPIPESTILCKIRELEPWFYDSPWTYALKDKKVLVIHPFEETIIKQYERKDLLYKNEKILPDFELKTIKAVQTIAGEKSEFKDWFEALESMKNKMNSTDFDVAIIGCGAYGFPLAAHAKKLGKIGIHLGGVTQLLFGIKGSRWENWTHYTELRKNNGKDWVYANEIPKDYKKVEHGCYW
jgi:hypothetical protein